jgi:hypothetical protein
MFAQLRKYATVTGKDCSAGRLRYDLSVLNGLNDLNLPREGRWWKTFFDCDK